MQPVPSRALTVFGCTEDDRKHGAFVYRDEFLDSAANSSVHKFPPRLIFYRSGIYELNDAPSSLRVGRDGTAAQDHLGRGSAK